MYNTVNADELFVEMVTQSQMLQHFLLLSVLSLLVILVTQAQML
jgi:hypothetical protein